MLLAFCTKPRRCKLNPQVADFLWTSSSKPLGKRRRNPQELLISAGTQITESQCRDKEHRIPVP